MDHFQEQLSLRTSLETSCSPARRFHDPQPGPQKAQLAQADMIDSASHPQHVFSQLTANTRTPSPPAHTLLPSSLFCRPRFTVHSNDSGPFISFSTLTPASPPPSRLFVRLPVCLFVASIHHSFLSFLWVCNRLFQFSSFHRSYQRAAWPCPSYFPFLCNNEKYTVNNFHSTQSYRYAIWHRYIHKH